VYTDAYPPYSHCVHMVARKRYIANFIVYIYIYIYICVCVCKKIGITKEKYILFSRRVRYYNNLLFREHDVCRYNNIIIHKIIRTDHIFWHACYVRVHKIVNVSYSSRPNNDMHMCNAHGVYRESEKRRHTYVARG
jgi:hypothetical protein